MIPKSVAVRVLPAVVVLGCMGVWFLRPLPLFDGPYSTVLVDRRGRLLSACIADDRQWRFPPPDSIPPKFAAAVVCFEDKRFRRHPGIDPVAVIRALRSNVARGRVVSGASTITMQTVRLSRRNKPRRMTEKCIEALLALRLELTESKDEILRLYAAHAPFGGNVVGLPAAAWRYFGRDPGELSWGESALLAVLPNNPALIHPGRNRELLRKKRDRLLERLRHEGTLDDMTAALAMAEPLPPKPFAVPLAAPHLLFRVKAASPQGAARVVTTLDGDLQNRVVELVERHGAALAGNGIHNAAALVVDIRDNAVRAYVGNITDLRDREHGNQVDVITAPRSTGSILKPFLYAGMMQAGELLPDQLVPDIPTRLGGFAPRNYSKQFDGAVPAASALARSLNIPAVRMLHRFGVDRFHDLLAGLGMQTLHRRAEDYGLTLILGGAEGTLWDIVGMYAGLARSVVGYGSARESTAAPFVRPRYIAGSRGETAAGGTRASLDAGAGYLTLQALLEVTRPNEERAWQSFASAKKIAWKTGTSYGFRDGWAVGVTPRFAVGVWVGNADGHGRPGLTGIAAAAPLLFDIFSLLPSGEWFDPPEMALHEIEVCAHSGYRRGPHCEAGRRALVHEAGLNSPACPYCRLIHCDGETGRRVHDGCEAVGRMAAMKWFVLPPAMEWYYRKHHADYRPLPAYRDDCADGAIDGQSLSLIYPRQRARVYVPLELGGGRGRVVFEAAHRDPQASIYWYLDEVYLAQTTSIHQLSLSPAPGEHEITLVDDNGETQRCAFTVLAKGK